MLVLRFRFPPLPRGVSITVNMKLYFFACKSSLLFTLRTAINLKALLKTLNCKAEAVKRGGGHVAVCLQIYFTACLYRARASVEVRVTLASELPNHNMFNFMGSVYIRLRRINSFCHIIFVMVSSGVMYHIKRVKLFAFCECQTDRDCHNIEYILQHIKIKQRYVSVPFFEIRVTYPICKRFLVEGTEDGKPGKRREMDGKQEETERNAGVVRARF